MLRALGIYSTLFAIVSVMFLLDGVNMFKGYDVYLWSGVVVMLALLVALKMTFFDKKLRQIVPDADKSDDSEIVLSEDASQYEEIPPDAADKDNIKG